MPYKGADDKTLPSYVIKLSANTRAKWVAVFNHFYDADGESMAFKMANTWLKNHIRKKSTIVKNAGESEINMYTMKFEFPEEKIVVHAEGDEEYIEAVLTDIEELRDGNSFDEALLYELAEQINKEGIIGDFNHEELESVIKQNLSPDAIRSIMRGKSGIARAVKAVVEKGKLWIRAVIDKRYKKRILESKGVSLEGFFKKDHKNGKYSAGSLFGFSFVDQQSKLNPVNPRAGVRL